MFKKYKQVYDLTKVLDENTKVFPGDPVFTKEQICSVKEHAFELQHLHICNHTGTHIDFPSHVINQGKTSSNYTISDLMAQCTIIDYSKGFNWIKLQIQQAPTAKFVFFKNVEYLSDEAVNYLIDCSIKLVGVDSLSVDELNNEQLPNHNKLLAQGILIVENLDLNDVCDGDGYAVVAPLNIANIDGIQVRVIMWR
jgi:arylformamidase